MAILAAGVSIAFGTSRGSDAPATKGRDEAARQLTVDEPNPSLGVVDPKKTYFVTFKLTNRGKEPMRILGAAPMCTCTVPSGLPMTIPAGETRSLKVKYYPPSRLETVEIPLLLHTNLAAQRSVRLSIRVEAPPPKPSKP